MDTLKEICIFTIIYKIIKLYKSSLLICKVHYIPTMEVRKNVILKGNGILKGQNTRPGKSMVASAYKSPERVINIPLMSSGG